nr:hypothetical protein [Candidatus Sigynarchaeota archaeon]MDO8112338.1 hypothetical protein [Candidatus Sigynarchaeota archaeon]
MKTLMVGRRKTGLPVRNNQRMSRADYQGISEMPAFSFGDMVT